MDRPVTTLFMLSSVDGKISTGSSDERDVDNHHLTEHGVRYLCAKLDQLVVITTNKEHPVFHVIENNCHIIYQNELNLEEALLRLKQDFACDRLTIQSGGTVNSLFLKEKLLDYIDIVVAPVLIGGKDTATLVGGVSLVSEKDLEKLGVLQLEECKVLEDSWVRLRYKVVR